MIVQDITSNLQQRAERVGQTCCGLRQVWRDTRQEAVAIVTHNSRSVANTEIGAAKNIYTSASAAYRRAKRDGLRKIAQQPARYVPAGRKQTMAAYRATLKLLGRTRADLIEVASGGYQQMTAQFSGLAESVEAGATRDQIKRRSTRARKQPVKRAATTDATQPEFSSTPRKSTATVTES